jgi:hypothetical protein
VQVRALIAVLALAACPCQSQPEPYRPPIEREPIEVPGGKSVAHFINMSDPNAPTQLVRGFNQMPSSGSWRWAQGSAAVRLSTPAKDGVRFVMKFVLPEVVFRETGPVTISVAVNGSALGDERYETPGDKRYERPVPPSALQPGNIAEAVLECRSPWTDPKTGLQYGFQLLSLGFVQ